VEANGTVKDLEDTSL